ncbi:hypothetical protein [Micromonospora carbonacea]|uniref:Uncharacterized protein n=1 Tax=Micromonospora carbonacea TaxID=47853 RepID=A0A7H8XG58_9ACTN|nr:hypothetical protein [Micromonospora carbonacea]MBB5829196.1 hypothetical protein [Micromonospora carbonacea]QLD23329.1 hypothetical protein HXZ27_03045 [Micromonospora carbonacea]
MRTRAVAGGRWGRLALLLCTLVGLAAMHTLGHGAHSGGTHSGHDGATPRDAHPAPAALADGTGAPVALASGMGVPVALVGGAAVPVALAGGADALRAFAGGVAVRVGVVAAVTVGAHTGCPAGGCAPDRLLADGGRADGSSGWSACLAVLGALGAALLVAVLLLTGARAAGPPGRRPDGGPAGPRAPPPRPLGLRLAEVSVSRT